MSKPPFLIIVVDTEEEFDWNAPFSRDGFGTKALDDLIDLQACVEGFGLKPCYVLTMPVLEALENQNDLLDWYRHDRCDLGTHLHPWVTPPFDETLSNHNSFAGNLPFELEYKKLRSLTTLFEKVIGESPTIYKAGRYGFGANTSQLLVELGYQLDLSIIGHRDLRVFDGTDMRHYPSHPFEFPHGLRALPMSASVTGWLASRSDSLFRIVHHPLGKLLRTGAILSRSGAAEWITVSPEGMPLSAMQKMTRHLLDTDHPVITMSLHSPSLNAGMTPYVTDANGKSAFLRRISDYIHWFMEELGGKAISARELLQRPCLFPTLSV